LIDHRFNIAVYQTYQGLTLIDLKLSKQIASKLSMALTL